MAYVSTISDPSKYINMPLTQFETTFDDKDVILYALGIGFNYDPLNEKHFKYTFQMHQNFSVFPTYGCCFSCSKLIQIFNGNKNFPKINPAYFLHAEQKLIMVEPVIKTNTTYITKVKVQDIIEKGKISLLSALMETFQKNQEKLKLAFTNECTVAVVNLKVEGFKGVGKITVIPKIPNRKADMIFDAKSYPNQAIVYRLSGDFNPLHIDPKFAAIQKFQKPILHGLATNGIVGRTIVQNVLENDGTKLKSFHSRFIGHVFPGQSYQISIWKENTYYFFDAKVKQRNTKVLTGTFQTRQQANL